MIALYPFELLCRLAQLVGLHLRLGLCVAQIGPQGVNLTIRRHKRRPVLDRLGLIVLRLSGRIRRPATKQGSALRGHRQLAMIQRRKMF